MFKIYDEPESSNQGACVRYDEPNRQMTGCGSVVKKNGEPGVMNRNSHTRGRV